MKTPILSPRQFNKIKHCLPVPRRPKKYDDRLVISGIIFIIKNGLPWRHLPEIYGQWMSVYMRFLRWSRMGIFKLIFQKLRLKLKKRNVAMLDSTSLKAHRTAASLKYDKKPRKIGRSGGGLTSKVHLLCTEEQQPLDFRLTEGQTGDAKMAPELIRRNCGFIRKFLADKAYDSNKIRSLLADQGIEDCIPPKSNRKTPITYDKELYKKRHVVENMFSRLKDWRGVAMRYCRCAHTCHSFICIALIFIFF